MEIGNMAYTLRESNKIIVVTPDNTDTRNFVEWWCDNNPGFPVAWENARIVVYECS